MLVNVSIQIWKKEDAATISGGSSSKKSISSLFNLNNTSSKVLKQFSKTKQQKQLQRLKNESVTYSWKFPQKPTHIAQWFV